jgi:uncharacterized damage-inducible protein DinB
VAETLIHIAHIPDLALEIQKRDSLQGFDFMGFMAPRIADEKAPHSKAEILKMLAEGRDRYAGWVEGLSEDFLGYSLPMPQGAQPPSRTRFDMLLAVKEHEMHHRGQLMMVQRMLGITPHLTRRYEEMRAQMQQAQGART